MKKLIQTKLHKPPISTGNCFPAVIASFLDLDSPEDVLQIQELYDKETVIWQSVLDYWLEEKGWKWGDLEGHLYDGSFYMVVGSTERSQTTKHVCIYQNGKLYHDPHPSGAGLITEEFFESLTKISSEVTIF